MKSRQVGLVLIALILLGIAGVIARLVAAGGQEATLSGLLPIDRNIIDGVTIRNRDSEAKLKKFGDNWRVGNYEIFLPKFDQFWNTVEKFGQAQLVSTNPANHTRMGVDPEQGTEVLLFLGNAIQERFTIGKWSPDVRLCYLKRGNNANVYAVQCPFSDLFDPTPDGWRDPVIVSIPRDAVEYFTIRYPDGEFHLYVAGQAPFVVVNDLPQPANPQAVEVMLTVAEGMLSDGFVPEQEAERLDFDFPDASLLISPKENAQFPATRVVFLKQPDGRYYVRNTASSVVYIISGQVVESFLRPRADYLLPQQPGG